MKRFRHSSPAADYGGFLVASFQARSATWLLQHDPLARAVLVAPPPLSNFHCYHQHQCQQPSSSNTTANITTSTTISHHRRRQCAAAFVLKNRAVDALQLGSRAIVFLYNNRPQLMAASSGRWMQRLGQISRCLCSARLSGKLLHAMTWHIRAIPVRYRVQRD